MGNTTSREKLRRRLSQYWKLELANVVFVPAAVTYLAYATGGGLGPLTWLVFLPMCGLLLVGGLYWRGKLHALEGRPGNLQSSLALADKLDKPLLAGSTLAVGFAAASWIYPSISASFADRLAACVCAALAGLEYVNYYRRQLQHFDHAADFKRLLAGKGFRAAQMAVDLARYRAKRA